MSIQGDLLNDHNIPNKFSMASGAKWNRYFWNTNPNPMSSWIGGVLNYQENDNPKVDGYL